MIFGSPPTLHFQERFVRRDIFCLNYAALGKFKKKHLDTLLMAYCYAGRNANSQQAHGRLSFCDLPTSAMDCKLISSH